MIKLKFAALDIFNINNNGIIYNTSNKNTIILLQKNTACLQANDVLSILFFDVLKRQLKT